MPKPRTITVGEDQVQKGDDGFVVTLPETVVTEEEVRKNFKPLEDYERLEGSVQDRVEKAKENARKAAREELAKDDAFLEGLVKDRKDWFETRFPKPEDVDPEEIISQLRDQEVKPLQTQLEERDQEVKRLRESSINGAIQRSMSETGVDDDHRELMEAYIRSRTTWSEEHGREVVLGEDGKPETKLVDGTLRPKTLTEKLAELRASGKFDHAFKSDVREGGGFESDGKVAPEKIGERIAALEKEGKFGQAAELKAQQVEQMAARQSGRGV